MEPNVSDMTEAGTTAWTDTPGLSYDITITLTPEFLKVLNVVIGVLGFLVNLKVVIVILNYRQMLMSRVNQYILNQSCIDMTVAVMLILATHIEVDGRYFSGPGDTLFCVLWISRMFLFGPIMSSTFNMLVMTIERYLSVVRPIWHKIHVTKRVVRLSMVFAWLIGPIYQFMSKGPTFYVSEGQCFTFQYGSKLLGTIAGIAFAIMFYFLPLLVLFVCYGHMALSLRKRVQAANSADGAKPDQRTTARKNVIKTLALVAVAFIVCMTIDTGLFFFFNIGFKVDFTGALHHIGVLMMYLNCATGPFIYMVNYGAYQRAFRRLVQRFTRGRRVEEDTGEGTSYTRNDSIA